MQDNTQKNENENIKEPKTTKQKVLSILKIVGNVLFYLVIICLLVFSIMNIRGGNGRENFPNIFGRGFLSVQSDSMKRSDKLDDLEEWKDYKVGSFDVGDLLYAKTFKDKDCSNLKVGDVITFFDPELNKGAGALNTHRIVYIAEDKSYVFTQGDGAAERQPFNKEDPLGTYNGALESTGASERVSVKFIKGVVTGVGYGKGKTIDTIQKYWIFIFILPVGIFLIFEILMVAKNIMALKNEKDKLKNPNPTKEELRAQILAELQAEQEKLHSQETATTEPTEKAPDTEPVIEATIAAEPVVVQPIEQPTVEEEPVAEESVMEQTPAEKIEPVEQPVVEEEPVVEEPTQEPVVAETPVEEETPVAEEASVEEKTDTPSEPIVEETIEEPVKTEPIEEVKEPVAEEKPKPVRKKSTSTGTKKSSSGTTKKASAGTKSSSGTTKKASTGTKASSSTTKKASTGTKKPASGTTKKASTGTKKSSSGTTKKSSSGAKTEKGE